MAIVIKSNIQSHGYSMVFIRPFTSFDRDLACDHFILKIESEKEICIDMDEKFYEFLYGKHLSTFNYYMLIENDHVPQATPGIAVPVIKRLRDHLVYCDKCRKMYEEKKDIVFKKMAENRAKVARNAEYVEKENEKLTDVEKDLEDIYHLYIESTIYGYDDNMVLTTDKSNATVISWEIRLYINLAESAVDIVIGIVDGKYMLSGMKGSYTRSCSRDELIEKLNKFIEAFKTFRNTSNDIFEITKEVK